MTLPNGIDGISEAIGTLFGSTGPLTVIQGAETWGAQGISQMNTLTQEAVTALLGQNVVKNSPNWLATSANIYDGLTPGIPWSLAIVEQIVSALTGLPLGSWDTMNEATIALNTYLTGVQTNNQTALQGILTAITDYTDPVTFWATINTIWQTWATTSSGLLSTEIASINQMIETAFNIDPTTGQYAASAVQGVGGAQSLVDTFDQMWDQLIAALGGGLDAVGLSGVAQLLRGLAINETSPMSPVVQAAQTAAQILATVDSQPVSNGLEATVESNGAYHNAAVLPNALTPTVSAGGFITVGQLKSFGFIQWMAWFTSTVTNFVINFYKMNTAGDLVLLFSTSDVGPGIPSSVAWILDDITAIDAHQSDIIAVEYQVKHSGAVSILGFTDPGGAHPTARIKQGGFSQNWGVDVAASTIAAADIGWSKYSPYVGLGVGTIPPTPFFPVQAPFLSGTHTMPAWAMFEDLIVLGGAGGGEGELGVSTGYGGTGGSWNTITLAVGTDIAAETVFTLTQLGAGGAGGPYFVVGSDGTATIISWNDIHGSPQTLFGAFGYGGSHALGTSHNILGTGLSPSPQVLTYQGLDYVGGADQFLDYPGNAPGGGGAGAALFQFGTAGAAGAAWTVDRQS